MQDAGLIDLGLTAWELWSLTPYQIARLFKRHEERERRWDVRLAGMQLNYLNWNRNAETQPNPLSFAEVFPELAAQCGATAQAPREQTTEEQIAILRKMAINYGAVVVKRNGT